MAFTDEDRAMLVRTAALLEAMKESHDRRLAALEEEAKALHHRVNVVHGRVNRIKFVTGGLVLIGSVIGSYFGLTKTGDN